MELKGKSTGLLGQLKQSFFAEKIKMEDLLNHKDLPFWL